MIMKSFLTLIIFCSIYLISNNGFSQSSKTEEQIPNSIYFSNSDYQFSTFNLNSKLNLNTYNFLQIENEYFRNGQINIYAEAFYIKPSQLVFDSYKKLKEKEYLEKSFFKVSSLYDLPRKNKNF